MTVLVSVSSRHGGTAELGSRVADGLRAGGCRVDVLAPDDVEHVAGYQAVVLGTSVYVGRVGLDLKDLIARQAAVLRSRPVWFFWSGPVDPHPERAVLPPDVGDAASVTGARTLQVFGGRVVPDALTVAERSLLALVPSDTDDHRDLPGAYAWGQRIAAELAASTLGSTRSS